MIVTKAVYKILPDVLTQELPRLLQSILTIFLHKFLYSLEVSITQLRNESTHTTCFLHFEYKSVSFPLEVLSVTKHFQQTHVYQALRGGLVSFEK